MVITQPKLCGIYAIYSEVNDTIYIGHSSNIQKRWVQHRSDLKNDRHKNPHIKNACNIYGEEAFEFFILEECPIELLLEREQYYLDQYPNHYNCGDIARSRLGHKDSDETRAKKSAAKKGHHYGVGRKHSPEHRAKISESLIGNKRTLGHSPSLETRALLSEALKGKPRSPEAVAKTSAANTGRKNTPEARAKMSAAQKARRERERAEKDKMFDCVDNTSD